MHENAALRVVSYAGDSLDTQGTSKKERYSLLLPVAVACADGIYGNEQTFLSKIFCLCHGISWKIWKSMDGVSLFWCDVCVANAFHC